MFKLAKVAVGIVIAGMLAYLFFAVPFGERTLYGYALRVFSTPEAVEAGEGISEGAGEYLDEAMDKARAASTADTDTRAAVDVDAAVDPDAPNDNRLPVEREEVAAPMDEHAAEDEAALRDLLGTP